MHIYYWGANNLGDLLNIYIGLKNGFTSFKKIVASKNGGNSDGIFMIGSVLLYITAGNIVMGVGFKECTHRLTPSQLDSNNFVYVRGNGTIENLGTTKDISIFEPGLVIRKYIRTVNDRFEKFLFLPHYDQYSFFQKKVL